jgi:hypothetical protein
VYSNLKVCFRSLEKARIIRLMSALFVNSVCFDVVVFVVVVVVVVFVVVVVCDLFFFIV